MKYKIEVWPIMKLVSLYNEQKLQLNPPYQRNAIWTIQSQKLLIDTIKKGLPLPTFFLQETNNGYDMVDGQQRTRAMISYTHQDGFPDSNEIKYIEREFDNYNIAVVILNRDLGLNDVREFYVRVNRAGIKLERPELNKAERFNTEFLKVTTALSEMVEFRELKLFRSADIRRMFDRDFVEELAALILEGPQDKKKTVDQLYKNDIKPDQSNKIQIVFRETLNRISVLNQNILLSETRFTQKNDFYTLFNLLLMIEQVNNDDLVKLYEVLVFISKGISPSNQESITLKEYASNCVTQSNSKKARIKRLEILTDILLNKEKTMNAAQADVAAYYHLSKTLKKINVFYTLDVVG
ncbi:DUF262 domain-containing protein [Pedobacter sp. UBA5917]|jgi:hypothetical protein|uniref:DUF262 domain-containing protein n=1 Tax=Pedobacter sp. UBA5917 TaxID=1947061 RepID=UPI0025FDC4AA|nr:DUF262 domain-containing protein [Pedobacter sp. UBA5917]